MKRLLPILACVLLACSAWAADLYFTAFGPAPYNQGAVRILDTDTNQVRATPFATGLSEPYSPIFLPDGSLLVCNAAKGEVLKFSPSGSKSVFASGLGYVAGAAVHPITGDVYVSDCGPQNDRGGIGKSKIYKFSPSGANRTVFASGLTGATGLAFMEGADPGLLVTNYSGGVETSIYGITHQGIFGTYAAYGSMTMPFSLVVSGGDTYVAAYGSGRIYRKSGSDPLVSWASGAPLRNLMGITLFRGEFWGATFGTRGSIVRVTPRLGGGAPTAVEVITGQGLLTGLAFKP